MKEAEIQFTSGRKIIVKDIIDYVESQDFDVIVTKDEEHITVFRNSVEYMIVRDILDENPNKGCYNCAYRERGFYEKPCSECYHEVGSENNKWEKEVK